jgi:hypothetical protein
MGDSCKMKIGEVVLLEPTMLIGSVLEFKVAG